MIQTLNEDGVTGLILSIHRGVLQRITILSGPDKAIQRDALG